MWFTFQTLGFILYFQLCIGLDIECVTRTQLGEAPHWSANTESLYFVNIIGAEIHRYSPRTKNHTYITLDEINNSTVSLVIPLKSQIDQFLVTVNKKLVIVTWDGFSSKPERIEEILTEPGNEDTLWNDGKVDPTGILWIGSMDNFLSESKSKTKGTLYSINKMREFKRHLSNLSISNGLAWSHDLKFMYYIDSPTKTVDVLDYDGGTVENRRTLFDLVANNITSLEPSMPIFGPDGMTIDNNGTLWVAVFNSGSVLNIEPKTGTLIRRIDFPTSLQTTSVAFGGQNLDELYVTSAKFRFTPEMEKKYPDAGCTFKVTGLGVQGLPGMPAEL